ncbi:MAG: gfo/Idh/MocA family oxidoreductase, partial [Alphaproteobacteria bacterium]
EDTHRDLLLASEISQGGGYNPLGFEPEFERHVEFLTSYPPGDIWNGQLWGPMREETNAWFSRVYTGLETPHATAADGHRNLLLTMSMDLSAKTGKEIELPANIDELGLT